MKRLFRACCGCWLTQAFSSSIGKKVLMAITGLALCGFLVVHLGGNLLLYIGAEKYNNYAHALHAQEILVLVAEVGLLVLFVGHIWLALVTNAENSAARPVDYAMRQSKQHEGPLARPASAVMLVTGVLVLVFLLVHLADFRFELRHGSEIKDAEPFEKALVLLRDPISAVVYVVGSIVLGYHLLHGFQSAFQTLGINHPKYTPAIKLLSVVFAIIVAAGFASFPVWAWAFKASPPSSEKRGAPEKAGRTAHGALVFGRVTIARDLFAISARHPTPPSPPLRRGGICGRPLRTGGGFVLEPAHLFTVWLSEEGYNA